MLNILKQFKKQSEHVSHLTLMLLNQIATHRIGNKCSIHTLRFFTNKEFGNINNITFKYCLKQALNYYSRDFNIKTDINNIYFEPKQLFAEVA